MSYEIPLNTIKEMRADYENDSTVVFGGEIQGILKFVGEISQQKLSEADHIFLDFLFLACYPYDSSQLIDWWENFVAKDTQTPIQKDGDIIYVNKYSPKEKERHAYNWFDRRLGKLVRIGVLNCTMDTEFLKSLQQSFNRKNVLQIVKQKLLESGNHND